MKLAASFSKLGQISPITVVLQDDDLQWQSQLPGDRFINPGCNRGKPIT